MHLPHIRNVSPTVLEMLAEMIDFYCHKATEKAYSEDTKYFLEVLKVIEEI